MPPGARRLGSAKDQPPSSRKVVNQDCCFSKHLCGLRRSGYAKFRVLENARSWEQLRFCGLTWMTIRRSRTENGLTSICPKCEQYGGAQIFCQDFCLIKITRAALHN